MLIDILLIVAGVGILGAAGAGLVDFASALGERARLTPAVIGLTIVALGTSMPEAFTSAIASLEDRPDIAVGNVVGSNIFNIAVILGVTVLIAPVPIATRLFRLDYPFMLVASWIFLLLVRDGAIDRLEAGFFLVSVVLYTAYAVHLARREVTEHEAAELEEAVHRASGWLSSRSLRLLVLGVVLSIGGLAVGARLLVDGAVDLSLGLGLSERVVGLTVVAAGTSLPELVTSIAAAVKRQQEIAVYNVVGSNIMNILLILGVSALINPLAANPSVVGVDAWVMLGVTLLLLPFMFRDLKLNRWEGAVMVASYLGYLTYLLAAPQA